MTGGTLSATAAGIIALVAGLLMSWKRDAPRTRLVLLIAGATTVTGGIFGTYTGKAGDTLTSVSQAASASLFGSGVGILGVILLTWVIVRATLQGEITRWTDTAAVLTPPIASAYGGLVFAACLLLAAGVEWVITGGWTLGAQAATMIRAQVG